LEAKTLKILYERIVKSFMDLVILAELRKGRLMGGYDVIVFLHKKFHLLMSSGTVYSLLYALERNRLIEGIWNRRKRVYKLTNKGEETINIVLNAYERIQGFMTTLL